MKKYDSEFKSEIIRLCLTSTDSVWNIARSHALDHGMVRHWVECYRQHGEASLHPKRIRYDMAFKLQVLEQVRRSGLSRRQVAAQFDIRCTSTIGRWERQYNKGCLSPPLPPRRRPGMPAKSVDDVRTREQLLEELAYLRAENAYLKKLDALIREQKAAQVKKCKPSRG